MSLLRVIAVLACVAYASAVRCAACAGQIDVFHLNPYAVCYREIEGSHDITTLCQYSAAHAPYNYSCNYDAHGEIDDILESWSLCPEQVDADAFECGKCHDVGGWGGSA